MLKLLFAVKLCCQNSSLGISSSRMTACIAGSYVRIFAGVHIGSVSLHWLKGYDLRVWNSVSPSCGEVNAAFTETGYSSRYVLYLLRVYLTSAHISALHDSSQSLLSLYSVQCHLRALSGQWAIQAGNALSVFHDIYIVDAAFFSLLHVNIDATAVATYHTSPMNASFRWSQSF